MSNKLLVNYISQLYERVHHQPIDDLTRKIILQIIVDNGLGEHCPDWLLELFKAIVEDSEFANRNLSFKQYQDRNYDVTNFFSELSITANFPIFDDGEYRVIAFDALGRSVCFDFEAYQGGVDVRLMRWPKGTGPHFDRWPLGHRLHLQTVTE
jgi:hypothetical protein